MVLISTARQSDPIIGVGTASPMDPVSSILKRYKGRKRKQQPGGFLTSRIRKIGTRRRVHKRRRR